MKNLITLFILAFFLVFTSCTKEELILEPATIVETEIVEQTMHSGRNEVKPFEDSMGESYMTVNEVQIFQTSSFIENDELVIDFLTTNDFSNETLETTQHLDFIDTAGNSSTLTFTINNYTDSPGHLYVAYALGTNDVTGLQLKNIQYIIIQDTVID